MDFFIADLHFGHKNIVNFKDDAGNLLRPFDTVQDMEEAMIQYHNEIVKPTDKVYMLGDIAFNTRGLMQVNRMNGIKILIKGNHDQSPLNRYIEAGFQDIRGVDVRNGLVFTHVPIHPSELGRFGCNVHGHLHAQRVRKARGVDAKTGTVLYSNDIDPRFLCVSAEHTNLRPISYDEMIERIVAQGGKIGMINGNGSTQKLFNSH